MRIESRIEALEERLRPCGSGVVIIAQNADGSWPPDLPEVTSARVVVCLHRQGILTDASPEEAT